MYFYPRGLALKIKAQILFPSVKFIAFFEAHDKSSHYGVIVEVMVRKGYFVGKGGIVLGVL